jgi:anti-sigma regulatory factor (Ser/Thr protein kinase)
MSAIEGSAGGARPATAPASELKWRKVFPGEEQQISALRRWLTGLLPECPARDDVVTVAVELATNAVKFTASGQGGSLGVEIAWSGSIVRVGVADDGAPDGPHLIEDPLSEHGRGLMIVRALSLRAGVDGDHRGRLAWADIAWTAGEPIPPQPVADAYEAAIRDGQAALSERFSGVLTWFGRSTHQWWALPPRVPGTPSAPYPAGHELLSAPSAKELAELLARTLDAASMHRHMPGTEAGAARASDRADAFPGSRTHPAASRGAPMPPVRIAS